MTFEKYQEEWNALKAGVVTCSVKPHHAIECLMAMRYTAREAEMEIENWIFEAQIQDASPMSVYHKIAGESEIIDNRNAPG